VASTMALLGSRQSQHLQRCDCQAATTTSGAKTTALFARPQPAVKNRSQTRSHDGGVKFHGWNPGSRTGNDQNPTQVVLKKLGGNTQRVSLDRFSRMMDDEVINRAISNPPWVPAGMPKKMQSMDEIEDLMLQESLQCTRSCRFQDKHTVPTSRSDHFFAVLSNAPSEHNRSYGTPQDHGKRWRLKMPTFTRRWRNVRTSPEV